MIAVVEDTLLKRTLARSSVRLIREYHERIINLDPVAQYTSARGIG